MLLILVVTASLQALRYLNTIDHLSVISVKPFAVCIGSSSGSFSNIAKSFLPPVKYSDVLELRIKKRVITSA